MIVILKSPLEVSAYWPFFRSALSELRKPEVARETLTDEEFLSLIYRTIKHGVVMLLCSKRGKPNSFLIAQPDTLDPTVITILSAFVLQKCPTRMNELQQEFEAHCKSSGYRLILAHSRRLGGAAVRWYRDRLGMEKAYIGFKKEL